MAQQSESPAVAGEPCFTLVFAGDIGATQGNPFDVPTPFGPPIIVSRGDTVTEAQVLRDLLDDAVDMLEIGDEANTPGTDTYTLLASTKAMLTEIDAHAVGATKLAALAQPTAPGAGGGDEPTDAMLDAGIAALPVRLGGTVEFERERMSRAYRAMLANRPAQAEAGTAEKPEPGDTLNDHLLGLIRFLHRDNAARPDLRIDKVTIDGGPAGNWTLALVEDAAAPKPEAPDAGGLDLRTISAALESVDPHQEAENYEYRPEGGHYETTEHEKSMLEDFAAGLLSKVADALLSASPPAAGPGLDREAVVRALKPFAALCGSGNLLDPDDPDIGDYDPAGDDREWFRHDGFVLTVGDFRFAKRVYRALAATRAAGTSGVERVRHVKHGTEYEVLGEAEAQVGAANAESDRFGNWIGLYEGHKLVVYRCVETGKLWCRSPEEFRDGRFVTLATINPADQSDDAGEGRR